MMTRIAVPLPLLAALAPFLLAGCATTDRLTQPEMTLVALDITEVTLFETSADVTVRITNPDLEPLVLEGGVVRLSIDGVTAGRGMFDGPLEVPRLSSETVDLTLRISNVAVATRLRSFVDSEAFSYRLRSVLYRRSDFGTRRIRIAKEGFVDFRELDEPVPDAP